MLTPAGSPLPLNPPLGGTENQDTTLSSSQAQDKRPRSTEEGGEAEAPDAKKPRLSIEEQTGMLVPQQSALQQSLVHQAAQLASKKNQEQGEVALVENSLFSLPRNVQAEICNALESKDIVNLSRLSKQGRKSIEAVIRANPKVADAVADKLGQAIVGVAGSTHLAPEERWVKIHEYLATPLAGGQVAIDLSHVASDAPASSLIIRALAGSPSLKRLHLDTVANQDPLYHFVNPLLRPFTCPPAFEVAGILGNHSLEKVDLAFSLKGNGGKNDDGKSRVLNRMALEILDEHREKLRAIHFKQTYSQPLTSYEFRNISDLIRSVLQSLSLQKVRFDVLLGGNDSGKHDEAECQRMLNALDYALSGAPSTLKVSLGFMQVPASACDHPSWNKMLDLMRRENVKEIALQIEGDEDRPIREDLVAQIAAHSEKIQFLSLVEGGLEGDTLRPLAGKSLKELEIMAWEFYEDGAPMQLISIRPDVMQAIARIDNLEKLSLWHCDFEGEILFTSFKNSKLLSLSLFDSCFDHSRVDDIA